VSGDGLPAPTDVISPGPVLLLRRGEPVEISVVNQLAERTALHWHGMELESFYDGVHNWSGMDQRLAPMIEPGGTFLVRFTPPRAGTFMYHTHVHDERQLPLGLYGSLIVVEPGDSYDASIDHSVMLGRSGLDPAAPNVLIPQTPLVINGEKAPAFVWKSGTRHRLRLMNITPDDILSVTMQTSKGPIAWTPVAKDGAPLPRHTQTPTPALQTVAVGETYDFEMDLPSGRQTLWLEVRSTAGKWEAQAQVIVR
jgi:FtsP/CotA-like multicopper oxidase with cupredoxin domain